MGFLEACEVGLPPSWTWALPRNHLVRAYPVWMYSKPLEKLKMTTIRLFSHSELITRNFSSTVWEKKKRVYSQIPRMALPPISRCPFLWSYVKINLKANAILSSLVWNLLTPNYSNKRKSINDRLPPSKLQISSHKPMWGFWKKVEGAEIVSPMIQYALKFPCSLECGMRTYPNQKQMLRSAEKLKINAQPWASTSPSYLST